MIKKYWFTNKAAFTDYVYLRVEIHVMSFPMKMQKKQNAAVMAHVFSCANTCDR